MSATPGAPAPIRQLPICEQLHDPPTGACPVQSDYFTVGASGSFDGSGAVTVTITPSIPPCATYNAGAQIYSPATCYTQILIAGVGNTIGAPRCEYLDDATGLLQDCPVPFQDTFAQWDDEISLSGTWKFAHGLPPGSCASVSNFSQYYEGGPSGSGDTWPELAALTGECTLSMDQTPDNLMGASWAVISGILRVAKPGDGGSVLEVAHAETYVGINGTLSPFAEIEDPDDPDPDPDPDPNPETPFTDVAQTSFAYDDITLLYELGITNGVSATEYGPAGQVTREQMAAFLARMWRALGGTCETGSTGFTDIAGSFAAADIECIFFLRITNGTSATTYGPSENVTREQMAASLGRLYRAGSS